MNNKHLKALRKELKLTQEEFAVSIGLTQAYISELETGRKEITESLIMAINSKYPDKIGHIISNSDKSGLMYNAKEFNFVVGEPNLFIVPLKAYGGFLLGYESEVYLSSMEKIYFPFIKGPCFAFEIEDYSMSPDYNPKDYIVTTEIEGPDWLYKGSLYVFQTIDGIIFKEFDKIEDGLCYLKSINDQYNPVPAIPVKSIKKIYFKENIPIK